MPDVIHRLPRWAIKVRSMLTAPVVAVVVLLLLGSCASSGPTGVTAGVEDRPTPVEQEANDPGTSVISPTTAPPAGNLPADPGTAAPTTVETPDPPTAPVEQSQVPEVGPPPADQPVAPPDVGGFLAPLGIDDRPQPWIGYDRADWPHWADTDGDGCDARQQALIAASISPAQVDFFRCTVVAGDWFSAYDGVSTDDSSSFDVDHLVPLRDAHWSGGWRWNVQQRRLFANDQANLWVVSASSNRSKGALTPDQWRPARVEVWCEFAVRWVQVKVAWGLTATTAERDALGSMLERCGALPTPAAPR